MAPSWGDLRDPTPPHANELRRGFIVKGALPIGPGSWEPAEEKGVFGLASYPRERKQQVPRSLLRPSMVDDFSATLIKLEERLVYLEGRVAELDGSDLEITGPDDRFIWCSRHIELLEPYKGGMVAISPSGCIVAAGKTYEEFEAKIKDLSADEANDLYVTAVDVFL